MSFPVLLFLALLGTAVLGFISAWFLQHEKMKTLKEENDKLNTALNELQTHHAELARESEINALTVENLQQLLLDYEQKVFDLQRRLIEPKPASNGKVIEAKKPNISLPNLMEGKEEENNDPTEETLVKVIKSQPKTKAGTDNDLIKAFKRGIEKERERIGS